MLTGITDNGGATWLSWSRLTSVLRFRFPHIWRGRKASNFDLAQRLAADNLYAGTPQTHRTGCWAPVPAGLRVVTGELVFLTGF